ncbi:MAG: bifunctional adenosylcobinamide kinase/adenosylcobinamide-phosphate guanylyltransferase [Actinobacteria bacterium HGW-Actinobacteria-1]|jgi:adenosylcobinamide kinase/adenosylcobinamide-phosphate guanylyltransferase|nr:MAG: bifunctional adenosylcobinamide kinase/adenosylcobinamide-phosphate guanylyltransferase [Actinobacteria bacterium HGW-Actinobacteria-1]
MALVVFTGGARSGKSGAAARFAAARSPHVVVAVAGVADDEEMATRIARHRAERPADWQTLEIAGESPTAWLEELRESDVLLLDCLGTLVTDLLWGGETEPASEAEADRIVSELLDALLAREGDTVIVTNEVGSGVVPVSAAGRLFRDVLGRANTRLVAAADAAYLVVCGRCIDISVAPVDPAWPTDR